MKGILFDLDGTLLNTLDDLAAAVNVTMDRFGWPRRTIAEVRRFVGNGIPRLMELSAPEGTSPGELAAATGAMRAYYDAHSALATAPYEGIPTLLTALKAMGVPMALVSNKPDGPVAELAERYFPGIFPVTVGDSPLRERKPAPDMPLYALEQLGLTVKAAVYVGDSEVDIRTARNAGLPVVAVTWGFRDREQLEALSPDYMVHSPEELMVLLGQL